MPVELVAEDAGSRPPGERGDDLPREAAVTLTGRRVALIAGGAFLVMLVPNIVLTVAAVRTFSGLVVPNSYVASQEFDRNRAAQVALGWQADLAHEGGVLSLRLADAAGQPVRPAALAVTVGRPTTNRDDLPARARGDPVRLRRRRRRSPPATGASRSPPPPPTAPRFRQSRDIFVRR